MYKPLTQNIRAGCLVWYFDPKIIPGTSHRLRSFWAGPYQVSRLIASALAEIKPVYILPWRRDVSDLRRVKAILWWRFDSQDPDRWIDEGELTELREAPLGEAERRPIEPSVDQRNPEIPPEPELQIQIVPENPEEIAVKEGIHKRIQVEIYHEDKEAEFRAEEQGRIQLFEKGGSNLWEKGLHRANLWKRQGVQGGRALLEKILKE